MALLFFNIPRCQLPFHRLSSFTSQNFLLSGKFLTVFLFTENSKYFYAYMRKKKKKSKVSHNFSIKKGDISEKNCQT